MATDVASRCLLSGLHVFAALAACGSLVAVLLQWAQNLNCLPPVTDGFGDPVSVKSVLGRACDMITYSSASVCGLSLFMAISLNCCWGIWCSSFIHQVLTLLMCVVSVGSGAALTVDFMLWCHSLQNSLGDSRGCATAAKLYDEIHKSANMTAYFRKMEFQQASQWAVVPFLLCAVIVYSIVMKREASPQGVATRIGGRYYILFEDESSPLLRSETTLASPVAPDTNNSFATINPSSPRPASMSFSSSPGEDNEENCRATVPRPSVI